TLTLMSPPPDVQSIRTHYLNHHAIFAGSDFSQPIGICSSEFCAAGAELIASSADMDVCQFHQSPTAEPVENDPGGSNFPTTNRTGARAGPRRRAGANQPRRRFGQQKATSHRSALVANPAAHRRPRRLWLRRARNLQSNQTRSL